MGRTPRSAADAPVGLPVPCKMPVSSFGMRDEGVPRGPGGPPHIAPGRHELRRYNGAMFFRRERLKTPSFAERLDSLRQAGFATAPLPGGAVRVSRGACAIDLLEDGESVRAAGRAGVAMGGAIGALVDGGYQKFFRTPTGLQKPALADELKALHDFEEDLTEALGQASYYNQSLGTTSTYYLYDRLKDRDLGVPKRIWE